MVICKYYQAGRCRYGDNCKFEHVDPPGGGGFHASNDPFATPSSKPNRSTKQHHDLQPQWPLSVIGSSDNLAKGNELSGDVSPEELRALAYSMAARGVSPQVSQREGEMVASHRAKVDALSRGGMQTHAPLGSNTIQMRDPFAENGGFSGGFGGHGNSAEMAMEREQSMGNPFGAQPTGNPFGQGASFGQQPHTSPFQQQPTGQSIQPSASQVSSSPQNLTPAQEQQFSAAQFGFASVPETAPPPRFY
ncbi:nucleoporin-like protein [Gracilaria domingensis]|nr:nucleoporin-like protein [Gracilaria domingensis]